MSRCLENLLLAEQDFGDHRGSSWTLDEIETGLEGNITIAEGILFAKAFIDPYCLPHLLNTHTPPWCWALSFLVICSMDNALLLLCSVQVSMPLVLLWMPSSPAVRQGYVLHVEIHGWSPFLTSNPWAGTPTSHLNTHTHKHTQRWGLFLQVLSLIWESSTSSMTLIALPWPQWKFVGRKLHQRFPTPCIWVLQSTPSSTCLESLNCSAVFLLWNSSPTFYCTL